MKTVWKSNRLTARLVRGLTGHAPIASYARRFHKESSECMCGHPFEDVAHVIHVCPLWKRAHAPATRLHLGTFVKFLKANPRAFEFPGADLDQESDTGNCGGAVGYTGTPVPPPSTAHPSSGAPPQGALAPPQAPPEKYQVIDRRFGGIANVFLYRRPPKPRAGRDPDPDQLDIRMFFTR